VSENAIEVSHLVKEFRIRHQRSLKQTLLGKGGHMVTETFRAVDDVSFSVPHGQTVAVIGRNGSGKSTLLGVLARVYQLTSGTVKLSGRDGKPVRMATLLELGAGFHPALTGVENIEFYGAVLGLNRQDVRAKVDDIVAFSELGEAKVLSPLSGWSDGQKLRLGFAIAIHTEPDILLVDEVLAVGDEAFQAKCYQYIAQFQKRGGTILFVTHDLPVVERVANRVIWMNRGVIAQDGDPVSVLHAYREASAAWVNPIDAGAFGAELSPIMPQT
jgi:ABC-type polysaccharide/polyol phosphate transport system ATPase subunit